MICVERGQKGDVQGESEFLFSLPQKL